MNDIGFNDDMLALVLAGKKTQTRRLMKTQLKYGNVCGLFPSWYLPTSKTGGILWPNGKEQIVAMNPYGLPGDKLQIRDTQEQIEIVAARVEPLCQASVEDLIAEGMSTTLREFDAECDLGQQFLELWDSIYGEGSAKSNPWVHVIEFKRVAP